MSSGKSTITKVVSVRIPNKEYARLTKKAGGKSKLGQWVQFLLIREATQ